jgi:hypothetical protein
MSFSHRISVTDQHALLDCGSLGQLTELQEELGSLLGEARFESSFGLLVELGQDGPILECTHALAVADAFSAHRKELQGRIALHACDEHGGVAALYIAMIGRHHGLRMEAFRERGGALAWLGGVVDGSA